MYVNFVGLYTLNVSFDAINVHPLSKIRLYYFPVLPSVDNLVVSFLHISNSVTPSPVFTLPTFMSIAL